VKPAYQLIRDLPDVACSHRDHHVTRPSFAQNITDDSIERRQIKGVSASGANAFNQVATADGVALRLTVADEVNIRHDHVVRLSETACEIIQQEARSRVLMRLEDEPGAAPRESLADRPQRDLHLRRMMTVVIDDRDAATFAADGHAAMRAAEFL